MLGFLLVVVLILFLAGGVAHLNHYPELAGLIFVAAAIFAFMLGVGTPAWAPAHKFEAALGLSIFMLIIGAFSFPKRKGGVG